jgi:putative hydrolase of the HAD superfamily
MTVKAVIFDLDNTLLDFMKMKDMAIEAGIDAMIEAGLHLQDRAKAVNRIKDIYEEKGWEYQQIFDDFILEVLGQLNYKILAAGIVGYRKAREASLALYPHVKMTLIELIKRGIKLAVISDAPSREAWLRICSLNLHYLFDVVVTLEDTRVRKPDPKPFLKALELLKLKPEETLMVGDWPQRDMVGAKKVGIKTIFARYGNRFGTKDSGADWEINEFSQILDIVNNLT